MNLQGTNIRSHLLTAMLVAGLVTSCTVTKKYQRPEGLVNNQLYRDSVSADTTNMATLSWRQLFTDTLLQALIGEGIENNLDLKIAVARIKQADANFKQSQLAFLPSLTGNLSASRLKLSDAQGGSSQVYQVYGSTAWEADIWGKLKSSKRAALAALLQSDAYKQAVQTQLIANIATSYYALLAYDAQLKITLATLENRKEDVETMKTLKESDVVTGAAVVQSEANRYSVEITIPDLQQNIRETENALSILLGRNPGSIVRDTLGAQPLTTDLRTGLPAQLLANRPDVREAEYQLRYYFEQTNVARAYFYPTLSITAEGGLYNNKLSNFFSASSLFGNIIGGLTQPIFNNGINKQRLNVAKAQSEEYLVTFKQTLLSAGLEVSNALFDYQAASEKITSRSKQLYFLDKSVEYTKELMKYSSATNYTDVLTSEQSLLAAQLSSINDKLQQMQAVVTLYRSLGGGWK